MSQEPDEPNCETPVISPADELRRQAAQYLIDHLEISSSLMARCEALAHQSKGDRTTPVFAAARLMQASADTARTLSQVANGETRHRLIVERVEPPRSQSSGPVGRAIDEVSQNLARRLLSLSRDEWHREDSAPGSDEATA
jgi:hypothetical protein